jgi:hypothetical protein
MITTRNLERTESFLTLLFAVSVFIWKPGIYVSSGLITAYLLVRSMIDHEYGQMVWRSKITQVSLAMFLLGLVTATIGAEELRDIIWMARKTLFLPVIVFFVFALQHPRNRTVAMTGLIGSFWIASLLTLKAYDWQLSFGARMEGTWPQGTWDTLLGLFFGFMVLSFKWSGIGHLQRMTHLITTVMALFMLLLAGGRAPWIGAVISLTMCFLIFKPSKRVLFSGIVVAVIMGILASTAFEHKARPVIDRFSSVFNTTTEGSNWIRLRLWEIGTAQLVHLAKQNPVEMLFGGGSVSYNPKQIKFFENMPYDPADRARLKDFGYPSGDAHSTYIDNALRHGVLWTFAMTLYLIWLCTRFSFLAIRQNPAPFTLLINFLIMGIFYTVVPHFATFFFVLFVTILGSQTFSKSKFL